jgi:small GTP-binding protein
MSDLASLLIERNKKSRNPRLDLGRCGLSTIPKKVFECIWLEELILSNEWWNYDKHQWELSENDFRGNNLTAIPTVIGTLSKLKILRASGNITYPWNLSDISALSSLANLEWLDLSSNKISDLSPLVPLGNLRTLDLHYNEIRNADPLQVLTQLQILDLGNNQLPGVSLLNHLPNLRALNLCTNQISTISLTNLENIRLELDFTTENRKEFKDGYVYLWGNGINNIPPHVLGQGSKFIIQYLKSQNKLPLNECKMIITGRGSVGKTSLQKRLFGNEAFNPLESETHGIRKRMWTDGVKTKDGDPIKVHFWDMGGQQEQQTLHQLFYTENAIYILMQDKRVDEDPESFLELIKVYGNNCPVIIVINNKINLRNPGKVNYNISPEFDSTLLDKYPNIRKVIGVCCGQENDPGLEKLKQYLIDYIPTLDHVREKYPVEWLEIKDELVTKIDANYIEFEEYERLCKLKNVNLEELQVSLARMLNNTGTVTYFDKPYLHYYILNPDWVTTGAYEIMLSPITARQKGRITFKDVKAILKGQRLFQYEDWDCEFLMKLMLAYSLCHEFQENQEWLIPSSLQGQPNTNLVEYKEAGGYRLYCLKYQTSLPQSIIHKFIARNINYAYQQDYWRNGIVLKHKDSETLLFVEADYKEKEIRVWIKGKEILEAWKFFRKDFLDLSTRFEYDEMVELQSGQNAMMSYKELMNLCKNLKKDQLESWYSPNLDTHVNVLKTLVLFDDVISPQDDFVSKHSQMGEREQIDMERKRLEIEKITFEQEKEEIAVKKWKDQALYFLIVSLLLTIVLVLVNIHEFAFVMSPKNWKIFKASDYFKLGGTVLAIFWNMFVLKMMYDRYLDASKEKAFREEWRRKSKEKRS